MWLTLTKQDTNEPVVVNMANVTDFTRSEGVTKLRTTTPKNDGIHIIPVSEDLDAIRAMLLKSQ